MDTGEDCNTLTAKPVPNLLLLLLLSFHKGGSVDHRCDIRVLDLMYESSGWISSA